MERIAALIHNVKPALSRPFVGFSELAGDRLEQAQVARPSTGISWPAHTLDDRMQAVPDLEVPPRGRVMTTLCRKPASPPGVSPGNGLVVDPALRHPSWSIAHVETKKRVSVAQVVCDTVEQFPVHSYDGSRFHAAGSSHTIPWFQQ